MNILLMGLNYAPEEIGIGPYTSGLARALAAAGHRVEVVAGKPYYPEWSHRPGPRGMTQGREGDVDVWRVRHYVPARPRALSRMVHYLSFAAHAFPVMWHRARALQPDLVLAVAPALVAAPVALIAARRAGVPAWLHIQDFEVEAALATGQLGKGLPARLAEAFERAVIRRFDRVSTISPAMVAKALDLGACQESTLELRNWAEIEGVRPDIDPARLRAELRLPGGKVALYSGNLAMKQGIGIIAEAARVLRERDDLTFLVCGNGHGRDEFAALVAGLANVRLLPLQPRGRLGELLAIADIHLLPQIAGAADAVLPSKLTNMLASGRPVVATAVPGPALHGEVAGCGLCTTPGDAAAFARAIAELADDPAQAAQLGKAARERAMARWSAGAILGAFERAIVAVADR